MRIHEVMGGGGLRLHSREWGNADGRAILFIHGWSQCHMCWSPQYESALAQEFRLIAIDLRGHGMSEKPLGPEHYLDSRVWADDIAVTIGQLGLRRPVVVAWSYGGFVICDYLRAYGADSIGAVNFVGGAVALGPKAFGTLIGPGFLNHFAGATANDLPTNIDAMRRFVRACTREPLSADLHEAALCWNMVVPAEVRLALGSREIDSDDVLASLSVPVLVSHGREDIVVLPAMAEHVAAICPAAKVSWYSGVGHAPHIESPSRFNRELTELARQVRS